MHWKPWLAFSSANRVRGAIPCAWAIFPAAMLLASVSPLSALDAAAIDALSRMVEATRVVEVPATVARLIAAAPAGERSEVTSVALKAAIKAHPALAGPCVMTAVRTVPEATEVIVLAVLESSPASALAIVSAAADADEDPGGKIVAAVSRRFPARVAQFEREIAVVRARQLVGPSGVLREASPLPAKRAAYGIGAVSNTPAASEVSPL